MKKRLTHPHPVWRAIRLVSGLVLLVVGLIGLALPVMPQWPFLIPALLLLAPESRHARRLVIWLRTRLKLRRSRRAMMKEAARRGTSPAPGPASPADPAPPRREESS